MWKLDGSRSRFYIDCGRPQENFWKTLFEQAGRQDLIDDPKYAEFLEWKPESSNCPELQSVATELVGLAPVEWRATMKNIFVARAFKGDANAEASSFRSAGIVEINHGLTMASMIYSTLFCHFYASVKTAATQVNFSDEDEEITQMIVDELERSAFEPILIADQSVGRWGVERTSTRPTLCSLSCLPGERIMNTIHWSLPPKGSSSRMNFVIICLGILTSTSGMLEGLRELSMSGFRGFTPMK